jgi:hypothetical protein
VTGYDAITGTLNFTATPDLNGSCIFVVFVRSGEGTGVRSPNGPLVSQTVVSVVAT